MDLVAIAFECSPVALKCAIFTYNLEDCVKDIGISLWGVDEVLSIVLCLEDMESKSNSRSGKSVSLHHVPDFAETLCRVLDGCLFAYGYSFEHMNCFHSRANWMRGTFGASSLSNLHDLVTEKNTHDASSPSRP